MKRYIAAMLLASLTVLALTAATVRSSSPKNAAKVRIGTYDSRAVAVAYCGTTLHKAELKTLEEALDEAKAMGSPEKVLACLNAMRDGQDRLHRQGFSTAKVDDILAKIPAETTSIKENGQLTALVSKWDKKTLAQYKNSEHVDVTGQLIDAFHPSDRQLKSAEEIQKHKPLSSRAVEKAIAKGTI
jgi:hypothetical protein